MAESIGRKIGLWCLGAIILVASFIAGYLLIPRQERPSVPPLGFEPPDGQNIEPAGPPVPPVPLPPGTVYHNDFTSEVGPEWSHRIVNVTLKGSRPYLGDFFPDARPALTLQALPPHKLIRVSFDLFLMKSWDGSAPAWGPSLLDVTLGGGDGRTLLHATFSNCGFFVDNNEQTFPDNYPARPYPAWTLGTEKQSLGTEVDWGGPARTFDSSGAYKMVFTFPHSASDLAVEFQSTLADNPMKPYGLTNVQVQALPELATFSATELQQLWKDLGSVDPKTFYDAHWKLISSGDAATELIAARYKELRIPAEPLIKNPGGKRAKPFPMEVPVIHRERARWVLEAIHSPAALALKSEIPTVILP